MKIKEFTPSEQKVIESYTNSEIYILLKIRRSNAGLLLCYVERKGVRKTKKHEPPFKYFRAVITKRGKLSSRYSGNIWDKEDEDIVDDFTKVNGAPWL